MGAPAVTYFCKNGHIVYDAEHHEVYYDEMIEKCPICGSTEIASECEWYDDDYGPHIVPYEPIRYEDVQRVDHHGNKYFIQISIYDITGLFK
jgi:hypothetical protein